MLTPKQAVALEAHAEKDSGDPHLNAMNVAVVKNLVKEKLRA